MPVACRMRSVNLLREPDAGNLHVRFDEREVETERLTLPRHLSTLPFGRPARKAEGNAKGTGTSASVGPSRLVRPQCRAEANGPKGRGVHWRPGWLTFIAQRQPICGVLRDDHLIAPRSVTPEKAFTYHDSKGRLIIETDWCRVCSTAIPWKTSLSGFGKIGRRLDER
jgi:hypothetical protein